MKEMLQKVHGNTTFTLLGVLLLICGILALGAYTYKTTKEGRYLYSGPTSISVRGEAEITRVPDVASFTFTAEAEAASPDAAQSKSAGVANDIIGYLEGEGVAETDITTTNYSVSPRYEYRTGACAPGQLCPQGRRELVAYTASQTIEVKVRDAERAGEFIKAAGDRGANYVSSLRFTLEDEAEAKQEARRKAIANAKEKADMLADALGVRLVRLTGFWEDEGYYAAYGRGGAAEGEALVDYAATPEVPRGENTIRSVVNLNYEIR